LIDLGGNVVGVNSQIYSRTGGFMGLSFAVPIELAMDVADQLKTKGHVSRGWLGVLIQDVTRDLAETFGMRHPRGALVAQVLPDSPAEAAGLQAGDVILTYNDRELLTSSALPPLVGASSVDRPSKLKILRKGTEREIMVVIGELPDDDSMPKLGLKDLEAPADRLGLSVRDLTPEQREQSGVQGNIGVLVEKVADGPARSAGVQAGDVILMLNNQQVEGAAQFAELVENLPKDRSVAVLVQREDGRQFMAMRVPE
jgi:serine protease Do